MIKKRILSYGEKAGIIKLCGNAGDGILLTYKGGCREEVDMADAYRCTGCGGWFHKECALKHFELEKLHDVGRNNLKKDLIKIIKKL